MCRKCDRYTKMNFLCTGNMPKMSPFLYSNKFIYATYPGHRKCTWNIICSIIGNVPKMSCVLTTRNVLKCHVYWLQEMCLKFCPIATVPGIVKEISGVEMSIPSTGNMNYSAHFMRFPGQENFQWKVFVLLNGAPGSSKLTLEKYYVHTKFSQCHNIDPQPNFLQYPRIIFSDLWAHSWNLGKFALRENNPLYSSYS